MNDLQNTFQTFQEYLDGVEELKKTEGWIVARKIEQLGRSYYIFKANYDELAESIWQIKLPSNLPLWGDDSVKEMEQFLNEVTRQLHNFVGRCCIKKVTEPASLLLLMRDQQEEAALPAP